MTDLDRATRRAVLAEFPTFIARCTQGHAVLEAVSERHELAAHTLGLLHSAYLARGGNPVTEAILRASLPYATRSRLGGEHWSPLISAGVASVTRDGWTITDRGIALLEELYREIRSELSRRRAAHALAGRLAGVFEPIAERVPATPRALAIRRLWGQTSATPLENLYRAVWELSIYRDACFRAEWERSGYSGPLIDALTQVWQGAATIDDLVSRLGTKQTRETAIESVRSLSERGDLAWDADHLQLSDAARTIRSEIEDRTDAPYFELWPTGAQLERARTDFATLTRELATASEPGATAESPSYGESFGSAAGPPRASRRSRPRSRSGTASLGTTTTGTTPATIPTARDRTAIRCARRSSRCRSTING